MKKITCLLAILALSTGIKAQMSGVYNIPTDFPTLGSAITALNTQGVSGPVTINIPAGFTETAATAYTLSATGTAANPIVFQKSGAGANPLITAGAGANTPGSALQDGIWALIGSDYVTIDGIDLYDPNTTNPASMEYGYGMFRNNTGDGCQNNTIKNCVISLNKVNNASGSAPAVDGSRGINVMSSLYASQTTVSTPASAAGTNSNNKFYSNTIQNCNIGIAVIGYAASSPFTLSDTGNDVGGSMASTGNTIINFGGGATTNPAAAIRTLAQQSLNVSYNTVNNNNGSGVNHGTTLRGIFINTATSASSSINSNTITLSSGATTSALTAIDNASGGSAANNAVNINNNVITNCTYSGATSGVFSAIVNSASSASLNINANTISNISLTGTATHVLIETGSPGGTATANSNTITNITNSGTSGNMRLIKTTTPATSFIANSNLIDGVSYTAVSSTGNIDGIYSLSSATSVTANNNIIRNISVPLSGTINGIRENGVAGNKTIQDNAISNFSCTAGGNGGGTLNGIFCTVGTMTISGNTVSGFVNGGAIGVIMNGINISGGTTTIYKNKISDLAATSGTAVTISGISLSGGATNTVYNNLIGNLSAPAAVGANVLVGINITGGTTDNVYYNTVNLSATSTSSLSGSSAVSANGTPTTINLRNNIFVNNSTATGTGFSVAYRRASTTLTNYATTSNNNLFYAGTPSAAKLVFYDGTNAVQTLAAYKTLMSTRDAGSFTENPPFVSTTGSNPNFLNINTASPTQIESGAAAIAAVTDDYAGTVRNATTPDIGAWEGNYTLGDLATPIVSGGAVSYGCSATAATYTVNIADNSGVATGMLSPRVYYKLNAGSYISVQGTLASGTATNGVWSFNLTYAGNSGDVVSYYLVAQDAVGNLGASPSAGFAGTDVNTVTTAPTTPLTYILGGTLNGTYNVGVGQVFPTLTHAAQVYNAACLTGPVTFELTDALYSTSETYPISFLNNTTASSTNSLLIKPAASVTSTITGSNATVLIRFNGADFIKVDGSNNGTTSKNLSIENTNAAGTGVVMWVGNSSVSDAASNISINNAYIMGNSGANTIAGIVISSGITMGNPAEISNNAMTISGNSFTKAQNAVYANGNATTPDLNWTVSNNTMGSTTVASKMGFRGMALVNAQSFTVSANTINGVTNSGTSASAGILIAGNSSNGTLTANVISDIKNTNSGGYGSSGISIASSNTVANIYVTNNFVSDIAGYGYASGAGVNDNGYGMVISNGAGYKIYHNTVFLNTNQTVSGIPASINITNSVTVTGAIDLRNNIFSNTQTVGNGYAIYSGAANTVFSSIDYNDYTTTSTNLAYIGSNRANLTALRTGFGSNLNSMSVTPVFVSATDLHLVPINNQSLSNLGTPVGVAIDIDNQPRNATTPDVGADEFDVPVCTNANGGTVSPSALARCEGQTFTLTSVGTSTGSTTSFQWQISTTSGGTYTNVAGGTGATTTSYTSAVLPAGTYYMVLQATCASASVTALSNEITVTINGIPTASASATSTLLCAGDNLNFSGLSNIGTSYLWSGPNSFTSTAQNPVISGATALASGNYTLLASANSCTSAPSVVAVTVNTPPTAITVTPSSAALCSGNSQTLSVTGGSVPKTMNFGTQANQNNTTTSTAYPAPYTRYYGGQKMQILILASELTGAGFSAGTPFTSVQFPVVSRGSNWPSSISQIQNFKVSMGHTNLSTLTAFQTGLTTVQPAANYTPTVGYANTHTFTPSAFVWDGTSNVVLETTFSDNVTGGAADAIVQYNSPTAFQSCLVYRVDGSPATTVANATTATYSYSARPDFKLNGMGMGAYTWSPATGLSATSGASVVATPTASTAYTVTSVNANCSSSNSVAINVTPTPTVNITATSASVCAGNSATLTASGATTYVWNTTATTTDIIVAPTVPTDYTVTGYNGTCSGTYTIQMGVNATPVISANSATICEGTSAVITPSGADTYTITGGAFTVSPTSTTSYSISGTSVDGCVSASDAVSTVSVNASPVISVNSATICEGTSAIITPSGADTYTITGGAFTVSPTTTTSYSVSGTSVDGCVSASDAVSTVSVNASPVITVNNPSVCDGNAAIIIPGGADTYTITGGTFTVTPSSTTSYSVTGTNTEGCVSSNTAVSTVSVSTSPVISVSSATVCEGTSAIITPSGADTYTITGGTFTVTPSTTTTYSVTGTSVEGCVSSNTAVSTVSVNASPVITVNSATICEGASAVITPSGADTYTITGGAFTVNPITTTSYSVTGTSVDGCVSVTEAVSTVSVNASPVITVNNPSVCDGNAAIITPSGADTYTITGGTFTVTPSSTTSYTVTGTSTEGCVSLTDAVSTVSISTSPVISVNSATICDGTSAIITPSGADTYTITGGTFTVTPSTTTTYSVTGTNVEGCVSTSAAVSTISVNASPSVSVVTTNTLICAGETVTLTATGADTYSWSSGSGTSQEVVAPVTTTIYTVTGTETVNGCQSVVTFSQDVDLCTAVAQIKNASGLFGVYPNPNRGEFMIDAPENAEIVIMSSTGQIVYTVKTSSVKTAVSIRDFASGIYFVKATINGNQEMVKIIKE